MSDIALQNATTYAARHNLRLADRLGFGIREHESKHDRSAIKAYNSAEFYLRERAVYQRLREAGVTELLGFHVPQFIGADDELYVIEMTIVTRPFVLDFAGAYLDHRPEFSEEAWAEWELNKQEQFGDGWKTVLSVIDAFEQLGIYLVDVSPSNIRFGDRPEE
jgi:hypothetical protein